MLFFKIKACSPEHNTDFVIHHSLKVARDLVGNTDKLDEFEEIVHKSLGNRYTASIQVMRKVEDGPVAITIQTESDEKLPQDLIKTTEKIGGTQADNGTSCTLIIKNQGS